MRRPLVLAAFGLTAALASIALPSPGAGFAPAAAPSTWLLPSSAHAPGSGGSFFTTSLSIVNRDARPVVLQAKFLGHDVDGTTGPSVGWTIPAGGSFDFSDVLSTVYGFTNAFGALEITADSPLLDVASQTSTPAAGGGSYGQSVPGAGAGSFLRDGSPGTIAGLREDGVYRTDLILANATEGQVVVHGELLDDAGTALGPGFDFILPPLGMTQSTRVVRRFTPSAVTNARIVLGTSTSGGAFAAYASVIDEVTNDPRTLLPATPPEPGMAWILPSSAHAAGAGGAFYTTDVVLTNRGAADAAATLRFLGHDGNGSLGPVRTVTVPANGSILLPDVLARLFGVPSGYGALAITADTPSLAVASQTSTPAPGGGSYGQSVPGFPLSSLAREGAPSTLASLREDASFRTNLVLANPGTSAVTVHGELFSSAGTLLGAADWPLPPSGMTQVGRVVKAMMGPAATLPSRFLVLSTPTPGGSFASYASVIDEVTNDPRTLLPR